MKKIILASSLITFGTMTAQTEKGTFMITGQTGLGFTSSTVKFEYQGQEIDGPKTNSFNISPSVGYFVIDNLAIGLDIDYKTATTKQEIYISESLTTGAVSTVNSKSTLSTIFIMPNATYFFSKGKARPYLSASAGIAQIKQDVNSSGTLLDGNTLSGYNNKNNGFVWSGSGGIAYFVTNTICFDLGLGYTKYSYKDEGIKTKTGTFGANIGISVFLK